MRSSGFARQFRPSGTATVGRRPRARPPTGLSPELFELRKVRLASTQYESSTSRLVPLVMSAAIAAKICVTSPAVGLL
jgi:hypothetical protein